MAGGLRYRDRDGYADIGVSQYTLNTNGAKAVLGLTPNDTLTTQVELAYNGLDTPLRAFAEGISTYTGNISVRYRLHESREWGGALGATHFTDGNRRNSASLYWQERLISHLRYELTGKINLGATSNSLSAARASYFNPSELYEMGGSLNQDWLQWQAGKRSLHHKLNFNVGEIWQQDYKNRPYGNIEYGLIYRTEAFEWMSGVKWGRMPYDGAYETQRSVFSTLVWRY